MKDRGSDPSLRYGEAFVPLRLTGDALRLCRAGEVPTVHDGVDKQRRRAETWVREAPHSLASPQGPTSAQDRSLSWCIGDAQGRNRRDLALDTTRGRGVELEDLVGHCELNWI